MDKMFHNTPKQCNGYNKLICIYLRIFPKKRKYWYWLDNRFHFYFHVSFFYQTKDMLICVLHKNKSTLSVSPNQTFVLLDITKYLFFKHLIFGSNKVAFESWVFILFICEVNYRICFLQDWLIFQQNTIKAITSHSAWACLGMTYPGSKKLITCFEKFIIFNPNQRGTRSLTFYVGKL